MPSIKTDHIIILRQFYNTAQTMQKSTRTSSSRRLPRFMPQP